MATDPREKLKHLKELRKTVAAVEMKGAEKFKDLAKDGADLEKELKDEPE